jgi:protein phosphatase
VTWSLSVIFLLGALAAGAIAAYQWTQTRYFVGESDGVVAIYQGVRQDIGIFPLSTLYEKTTIEVDGLPPYQQEKVFEAFPVDTLDEAREFIERLGRGGP